MKLNLLRHVFESFDYERITKHFLNLEILPCSYLQKSLWYSKIHKGFDIKHEVSLNVSQNKSNFQNSCSVPLKCLRYSIKAILMIQIEIFVNFNLQFLNVNYQ